MHEVTHLRRTEENAAELDALARQHGDRVGLPRVLDTLNRQASPAPVPGRLVGSGFTWNDADRTTQRWWPQGITTSADAGDDPGTGGRRVLVTSWYAHEVEGQNHGSRVTFVDLDTLAYRHVLLVVPGESFGRVVMKALPVHAGGLVWWGPYLHVAGTRRGLLSCRLEDIIEVTPSEESFGYRFVLPVRFGYDAVAQEGTEKLRYSFLSLDRSATPPELVGGEYGHGEMTRRLVRYPLDPASYHLDAAEDGISRPVALDDGGLGHMQGATVVDDTWYVTTSRGRWRLGQLHVGRPGDFRTLARALPPGPEDISYWPSTRSFWSLSEHPGKRFVFSVTRDAVEAALAAE